MSGRHNACGFDFELIYEFTAKKKPAKTGFF